MKPSRLILISLLTIALLLVGGVSATLTEYSYGTPTAISQYGGNPIALAWDGNYATNWESLALGGAPNSWWAQQDYGAGVTHVINRYNISVNPPNFARYPISWRFEGRNATGDNWVVLDSRTGQTYVENLSYSFTNTIPFRYYNFNVTENSQAYIDIAEFRLFYEVIIPPSPISSFTSQNVSIATNSTSRGWEGLTPFTMQFTNTSTSPPHTSWVWNYTALGSSTPVTFNQTVYYNPIHTFDAAGNYSIELNVTGTYGTNISTQVTWVNVTPGLPTIADFVGAPTTGYATTDVSFVDFSTGDYLYSWNWDFGDGSTSTTRNPTHPYTTAGVFDVSLTVAAPNGTSTKTRPAYITMAAAPNPDASSTLSFQSGSPIIANLTGYTRTVQLSNSVNASWINGTTLFDADHIRITTLTANTTTFVSNTISSYSINNATGTIMFNATNTSGFKVGTIPLSFMDIGMVYDRYSVGSTGAAWGTGSLGNSTFKVQFPVATLTDTPLTYEWKTYSNFSISDAAPTSGVTVVSLTPSDNPQAADRFLWNFGDGTSFLDHNGTAVTHVYTSVGMPPSQFSTSLTAYLSANTSITNTTTRTISPVYAATWIKANFTAGQITGQPGTVITFVDSSEYGVTTGLVYNWTFGDPFSIAPYSNLIGNAQHVYNNGGVYDVNLTITNTAGSSSMVKNQYITISTTEQKLNLLYFHETRINVVDTRGAPIDSLPVTIQMVNSSVDGTNWLSTLFGTSGTATPVEGTMVTGFTDSYGAVVFTSIGSGLYELHFFDPSRGIDTKKTLHPSAADYTFVISTTASAAIPSIGDYIRGNLSATPIGSNVYLNMSYNDTSSKTTNVNYFIVFPNQTTFYTKNFAGTPTTNQSVAFAYPVANVRGDAYVWGYTATSTQWGLVNRSMGITLKGVDGILFNPFVYKDRW